MATPYSLRQAELDELFEHIRRLGAELGLDLQPATARPVNSFDAHRLIHLAADHGTADEVVEGLFHAHLVDNVSVADPSTLFRVANRAGLPADRVQELLDTDTYADAVRADEQRAARLGIHRVPYVRQLPP
jgi:predicted DsbA family dithiol-disulfide isomerase